MKTFRVTCQPSHSYGFEKIFELKDDKTGEDAFWKFVEYVKHSKDVEYGGVGKHNTTVTEILHDRGVE